MIFQTVSSSFSPSAQTMSALIHGKYMVITAESMGKIIPRMAVSQKTMKKHHGGLIVRSPFQVVNFEPIYLKPPVLRLAVFCNCVGLWEDGCATLPFCYEYLFFDVNRTKAFSSVFEVPSHYRSSLDHNRWVLCRVLPYYRCYIYIFFPVDSYYSS